MVSDDNYDDDDDDGCDDDGYVNDDGGGNKPQEDFCITEDGVVKSFIAWDLSFSSQEALQKDISGDCFFLYQSSVQEAFQREMGVCCGNDWIILGSIQETLQRSN